MIDSSYVYFLPRTDDAAEKKTFLLIQQLPGYSTMISDVASVKEAVSVIRNIRLKTPWCHVLIDTGCLPGRNLLTKTVPYFPSGPPNADCRLYLAQLFHRLRETIPKKIYPTDRVFLNHVTGRLFAARNQGGRRPCTEMDILLARVAAYDTPDDLPERLGSRLYDSQLCSVPKFFLHRALSQGLNAEFAKTELVPNILRMAGLIAKLRQSPFPESYHNWLFETADSVSEPELKSRVDDFIYRALDGTTSKRNKCRREYPIQAKIVRSVDRFLESINIEGVSLFSSPLDRYERIRGFLELILETWSMALYADRRNRPQIVNLSRLNERCHVAFVHATTAI